MVTIAVMKPPTRPSISQGPTTPGSRESKNIFQGQMAVKTVIASRMAVLSTVPWTVIARASVVVEEAVRGSTPTKPPNDLDENAGFEVRNAVLMAMRGA